MNFVGPLRVYFNRHGAEPLMWCVAPSPNTPVGAWPRWEIAVRDVVFHDVTVRTMYRKKSTPDDEDGKPSAWLEVTGEMTLGEDGIARIHQAPSMSLAKVGGTC